MVTKEETLSRELTRYRLATALIWVGVLTWIPFIILRTLGQKPSLFWFLPFHLIGVVGGSRLKAAVRREMGAPPTKKTLLRTVGHILVFTGIMVWVVYFSLKLIFHLPVEVGQFLPYHLTAMLSGIVILLVNFLVNRQKS
jgi:hypothetical protein